MYMLIRCTRTVLTGTVMSLCFGQVLFGHTAQEVTSERACPRCTLRAERIATLGDREGPGIVGDNFAVARGGDGRFFVSYRSNPGEILVFDSMGAYTHTVGREGDGPGEFRVPSTLAFADGRLHVFDSRSRRHTVLDRSFEVLHTHPMRGIPLAVEIFEDGVVYNAVIRTWKEIGFPLHFLSADGSGTRSFGEAEEGYRPDIVWSGWRVLARAAPNALWAAYKPRYVIEKWSLDGDKLATLTRRAEWFEPHNQFPYPDPDQPPRPFVRDIYEDSEGLLWVIIIVADREWQRGIAETGSRNETNGYVITNQNQFLDSVIEVIDPAAGVLVTSERFDLEFKRFLEDGTVVSYREEGIGFPYIDVWRVQLSKPTEATCCTY